MEGFINHVVMVCSIVLPALSLCWNVVRVHTESNDGHRRLKYFFWLSHTLHISDDVCKTVTDEC